VILVAGGTGVLGTRLVALLTDAGLCVRVMTRNRSRAGHLRGPLVEIVEGDAGDRAAVRQATTGATTVVSAIQGFGGVDPGGARAVDGDGNSNLITEAVSADVERFLLVSTQGASARHPMELFRMKYRAEQELMGSPLDWTILRPAAYLETWIALLGQEPGPIRVFGRGDNPINFVSARDVASVAALAITGAQLRREAVDVGGPENLSFNDFAGAMLVATGRSGRVRHVPRPLMRAMATLLRPTRPILAAQIGASVVMDTRPMTCDTTAASRRWPQLHRTTLAELITPPNGSGA
jgi:uncharacterized protein YbjT (DUF2867 family)